MKYLNYIAEFQGLIGALSGVTLTFLLTGLTKYRGNITVYLNNFKMDFLMSDGRGGYSKIKDKNKADHGYINFSEELYNSSEVPKSIRQALICFYNDDNRLLFSTNPLDNKSRRSAAGGAIRDPLNIINVAPKNIIKFEIFAYISKHDWSKFKECRSIYYEYESPKGKKTKNLLKKM